MIFKVGSSFDVGPDQTGFLLRRDDFVASPSSDALLGLDSAHSLWYMVDISLSCSSVSQEIFRWFAFKSCADLAGGWIDSSLWDFSEAESDTELC